MKVMILLGALALASSATAGNAPLAPLYSEGDVRPGQNELRFPEERYEQDGRTMVLRTIWRFEGDTKMLAVTEQQRDGRWVEAWRIAFSRE
jgi:hypothetical protein